MNGLLAPVDIEAIAQESRNYFLYEEGPDYLVILEQGIAKLATPSALGDRLEEEYQQLIRTAHSLKGGAGLATMPELSQLSHKLEDLLIAIQEKRVALHEEVSNDDSSITSNSLDRANSAYELLLLGLDRVSALLLEGLNNPELPKESNTQMADPVCDAIDAFLQSQDCVEPETLTDPAKLALPTNRSQVSAFVKIALEVDLEDCLQTIESSLRDRASGNSHREAISNFAQECTLLGETLGVTWLSEIASEVEQWCQEPEIPLERVTQAIAHIRQQRDRTLNGSETEELNGEELKIDEVEADRAIDADPQDADPQDADPQGVLETSETFADLDPPELPQVSSNVPQRFLKYLIQQPRDRRSLQNMNVRVSLSRIDRMTKTVATLLMDYERLAECQQQLESGILHQDSSANSYPNSVNLTPELNLQSSILLKAFSQVNQRIDNSRIDIVLGARHLRSNLAEMRESLEQLHGDLTEARMVPFREMTERFFVLIDNLNQQYKKSVKLLVSGQDVLIDRWILEQLQTPLTHLIRNAFDHGIELPGERAADGKSERASIQLSASSQGSDVMIEIADNGRGIDPQKVYQKALSKGLISEMDRPLAPDEILQFLFTTGFSTAPEVTDISGRGVGLDIVAKQVTSLRGSLEVNTALGTGTKFTITIPLTLSLLSLTLFQSQQKNFAIAADKILEVIRLTGSEGDRSMIQWQNQEVPIFDLEELLSYGRHIRQRFEPSNSSEKSQLGLVIQVKDNPVVLAVDSLLGERRLLIKPLDSRVPVPPYVTGCTVLGNGEVIPVFSADRLSQLMGRLPEKNKVNLPIEKEFNHNRSRSSIQPKASRGDRDIPGRILIVDDSRTVRRSLQQLLSKAGFVVEEASDGEEGFATVERSQGKFDLVISDLEMPNLDGFGFLRKLRQSQWKNLSVAMLTSRGNEEYVKTAKNLGVRSYFTKPFQPGELLNSIIEIFSETR